MKTNFEQNEVLTSEDLNANFTECAGKADADDLHGLENIVQGLENSKADVEHTQVISTITGLQSALDDKLGKNLYKLTPPVDVDTLTSGVLYVIKNPSGAKLNMLITRGIGTVHFHQLSGELTNYIFIIRKYESASILSPGHYFIEVVGAWD